MPMSRLGFLFLSQWRPTGWAFNPGLSAQERWCFTPILQFLFGLAAWVSGDFPEIMDMNDDGREDDDEFADKIFIKNFVKNLYNLQTIMVRVGQQWGVLRRWGLSEGDFDRLCTGEGIDTTGWSGTKVAHLAAFTHYCNRKRREVVECIKEISWFLTYLCDRDEWDEVFFARMIFRDLHKIVHNEDIIFLDEDYTGWDDDLF